ncbi:MAG: UDP-3-O-(3-hydroxymyristoyl)glucosamine N-acyltransferase [Planctomycetota bacterium]|jgi:UDP-3-O-[3-hydroxymyristoyl] glucosamine N-acyltransferase
MPEMTLSKLAGLLGGRLEGRGERIVKGLGALESAGPDEVTFLANVRYEKFMSGTSAAAVIVAEDYKGPKPEKAALIRCKDPYFAFREAMVAFCGFREVDFEGIDERADVHPTARLGKDVRIGAFVTISAGVTIGDGSALYPGVYVGANCRVGRDCRVFPNVTLYDGTILHDRVMIHAGSSIGQDGFGYATHKCDDGIVRHEKIPQAGWVELEDDVEIGSCCAIDRATMGATIIGAGTKFSNLVAIGHGTKLGKGCLLVAQAGLAGSVIVGDYCVFAGQCGVVGHIRIGDGARIGAQAGVKNDVPPGQEMLSSPAIPLPEARRAMMSFSRLPQIRQAVRKLTKELSALKDRIKQIQAAQHKPKGGRKKGR